MRIINGIIFAISNWAAWHEVIKDVLGGPTFSELGEKNYDKHIENYKSDCGMVGVMAASEDGMTTMSIVHVYPFILL